MLECLYKFDEFYSVWRQAVFYLAAALRFIEQTGVNQSAYMLGNRFKITPNRNRNSVDRYSLVFCDQQKNFYSTVISRSLKISLQLLWRFWFNDVHVRSANSLFAGWN